MAKKILINKTTSRNELDEKLAKLHDKKTPLDIDKYFGKIDFGSDGLEYQLKVRDEWK